MVASCALRCVILLAFLCGFGASLFYSGDPGTGGDIFERRYREEGLYPWPEDREVCNRTVLHEPLSHGVLREQYTDMFVRMQGKRFLFAGDSLMDMVFHPLFCSAAELDWQISDVPVGSFGTRSDVGAGCMAKMFIKKNHQPIVMAFMRFYNYGSGNGNIKPYDVFHFPITPPNFDVVFMNMAHNSFHYSFKESKAMVDKLVSGANKATNVGRVVFLGHPPQHFKTKTGEYAGPEIGECMCHDKAALEKQPIFDHNQIVQMEVRKNNARSNADRKCAFANPWSYYADKCKLHPPGLVYTPDDHADCTHWYKNDVAMHAPFLKDLVAIAGL